MKPLLYGLLCLCFTAIHAQGPPGQPGLLISDQKKFKATTDFLDAAINSINSFNSLVKKDEIQTALKPLLAKAKNTNTTKFSQVVSALVNTQSRMPAAKAAMITVSPVFTTLISLVGNLTIQEKKITSADLDSFILATSKYFVQYEKLNQANILFDQNVERINNRLKDLQFDIKEYMLDMITILNKNILRTQLKTANTEELFLKYLDKEKLEEIFVDDNLQEPFRYPADGIKTAKDIAYNLQKVFNEYQKVYSDNYQQIRSILLESKTLGKNINTSQVDISLKELEELYTDSKNSDVLSLRLTTLFERLKTLAATEQQVEVKK